MLIEKLEETGALLEGHFRLSSGKHSNRYIQCSKLTMYPEKAEYVAKELGEKVKNLGADLVCGPAMGGVIISYELGRQLGLPAIFTERVNGEMELRRGFSVKEGEKVLVVEDVVTTGKSSMETIKLLESMGAEVLGVVSIVDRSQGDLDFELYSAIKIPVESYDEKDCPMCKEGQPITSPGSRFISK